MQIHDLKRRSKQTKGRRVGRGGKRGKTSGRGTKGQKARAGRKLRPEIRDMIKKLPKLRGRGIHANKPVGGVVVSLNVAAFESAFASSETVNPTLLVAKGLIRRLKGRVPEVKILGTGNLTKKLTVKKCVVSASARSKIIAAGGTVN